MATQKINWGSDDPEMIQQCLNCKLKRCTNCLERVPVKRPEYELRRIDPETGAITAVYPTYAEAGRQNNLDARRIKKAAQKQRLYGNYLWETKEKE